MLIFLLKMMYYDSSPVFSFCGPMIGHLLFGLLDLDTKRLVYFLILRIYL